MKTSQALTGTVKLLFEEVEAIKRVQQVRGLRADWIAVSHTIFVTIIDASFGEVRARAT